MRADEHEGDLNSTEIKRAADQMEARRREMMRDVLAHLAENEAFLIWFGIYAYPALLQNFPVNGGALLNAFMGRRELVLEQIDLISQQFPGFFENLIRVRKQFQAEIEAAAKKE